MYASAAFLAVRVRDVITWFKFGDDRLRGFLSAEGQILLFPIDFDGRPYNTLTLPRERVIFAVLLSEVKEWIRQYTSGRVQNVRRLFRTNHLILKFMLKSSNYGYQLNKI